MGDPRRRINWRVSARQGQGLFTNEFEQERIADIGLILDLARADLYLERSRPPCLNTRSRPPPPWPRPSSPPATGSACLSTGTPSSRTYPGYGKVQLERIPTPWQGAAGPQFRARNSSITFPPASFRLSPSSSWSARFCERIPPVLPGSLARLPAPRRQSRPDISAYRKGDLFRNR